jgi:general secretion pathway protein J
LRQRGFTLVELLVAMAVLAMLGALGFRGLGSILDAEARLQAESRRWSDVSLLYAQLSEDLSMAVERAGRDGADHVSPALLLRAAAGDPASADDAQLAMTRLGIGAGGAAQSAPRRVGYRLRQGTLEYLVWPALDAAPGAVPTAHELLNDVAELHLQALDNQGRWLPAWPGQQTPNTLPRAVTVRIVLAGGEEITRVLAVR